MSFGWSGSDVFLLAQLAWRTFQNSREACGEHDELTRAALRSHAILQRLEQEVAKPGSPINRAGETSKEQLERIASDCQVVLKKLDKIVTAYASLSDDKRSARKIWQRVRFGNGQMADLGDLRSKLVLYTSEMLFYLNLVSMSTVGRIEQRMDRDGGVLREIKIAVEKKTAHTILCGGNQEGSVLTSYADDDIGFWRGLRRDLIKDGLPSSAIHKHKHLIKEYVKELGARGILDDDDSSKEKDQEHDDVDENSEITEEVQELPNDCNASLDHNIDIQPLEDLNKPSLSDSLGNTIAEDIENEPRCTTSRATTSMKEQLHNTTEDAGIRPGGTIKSTFEIDNSNPLEPAYTEREPQKISSTNFVPLRPAEKRSRTSRNGKEKNHSDPAKSGVPERAAQNGATGHALSHDGYFPCSAAEIQRCIRFVVTPTGICHEVNLSLLYERFGLRIEMMLECLPERSLLLPKSLLIADPYYAADVETIVSSARSALEIIQCICYVQDHPPISLMDFRPKNFVDELDLRVKYDIPGRAERISKWIAAFDRHCYDVVLRIRRYKPLNSGLAGTNG